jgi:hypothetical protein
MLYALLGALLIVLMLGASAASLFVRRRDESRRDRAPEFPDAEGMSS